MAPPSSEPNQHPSAAVKGHVSRRLWVISLLGLLAIGFVGTYLYLTLGRPVGSGPAGPPIEKSKFMRVWSRRPVFLVGLGDSVTAGFGARQGYGYFERLIANPPEEIDQMKGVCLGSVFPSLKSTNLSVSGSISQELIESQLPRLPVSDAQTIGWIVITTGGNNLIHNYGRTPPREQAMYGASWAQAKPWVENFERRLEAIVVGISNRFPAGFHIFLANIYDPTDGVGDVGNAGLPSWPEGSKLLAAYNDVISRCADKHPNVHLVNLYTSFLGHGIHCAQFWSRHYDAKDPHYWYYTNLEDPNERGYDAIRRAFLIKMNTVAKNL